MAKPRNGLVLGTLLGVAFGMVGLSFAAVPLYRIFCQATGFGGTTQRSARAADHMLNRTIEIRFDATVAVKIVPGESPTVVVTDLANKTTTTVQAPNLKISGKQIKVVIPGSLLPSTGLARSQFRYDFWPEDGLAGSTNIASFAPNTHDIRVGLAH